MKSLVKHVRIPALLLLGMAGGAQAQEAWDRPREVYAGTYSIAGYDPETGQVGVAVTSRVPCVGTLVPHVRLGAGAAVTQAAIDPHHGDMLLEAIASGKSPNDALAELLEHDTDAAYRQIAVITMDGRTVQYTGPNALPWAGHRSGRNYVTQGNILVGPEVLKAVADAFERTEGTGMRLAERLIDALEAGERKGGDRRKGALESAALLVIDPRSLLTVRSDHIAADIDICEHEAPIAELRNTYNAVAGNLGHRTLQQFYGPDVVQLKVVLHLLGYYRPDEPEVRLELSAPFYTQEVVNAVNRFREDHDLAGPADGSPPGLVDQETIEAMWDVLEHRGMAVEARRRIRDLIRAP